MTAEEWEAGPDLAGTFRLLKGRTTARKFRLFGVACCRGIWDFFVEERLRLAVEAAEVYADGPPNKKALRSANQGARDVHRKAKAAADAAYAAIPEGVSPQSDPAFVVAAIAANAAEAAERVSSKGVKGMPEVANVTVSALLWWATWLAGGPVRRVGERAPQYRAPLLHCIFSNPFRPPFTVSPATLAHNDGTAVKLATVIYEERNTETGLLDPARLAILADALEEAGVDDVAVLDHLRGPGPHCRGCHVVDAILGRS